MSDKTNTKKSSDKLINIIKIKECYEDEFKEIVSLGNKMGFTKRDIENNPEILLHLFYSWLDITK
tara:strand:- start:190 stop:384 length:195 start_codon:yes stop_codon:yes gene_type:complete